jgi:hypothetical protein
LTLTPVQDSSQQVLLLSMLDRLYHHLVHSDRVLSKHAPVMIPAWLVVRKRQEMFQDRILDHSLSPLGVVKTKRK